MDRVGQLERGTGIRRRAHPSDQVMDSPAVRVIGPPTRLADEIERSRLLELMRRRWTHRVTVLVAGAGFGKSTLLAQAVRDNAVEPRGIDVWYECVPGDEDGDQLGRHLTQAFGVGWAGSDAVAHLAGQLARYSPIDVSLMIDDAHLLPASSSGCLLLEGLVRALPANAHLVIASRSRPPAALARLRAADQLLQIDEDELGFDGDEVERLSTRLGRDPATVAALGGWPALVRLALAVRPEVALSFAQEEVLSRLSRVERRALFTLANVGLASSEVVGGIVGSDVDLVDLCSRVPLTRCQQGLYVAHELWGAAAARMLDASETTELRARLTEHLVRSGDVARAGAVALSHGDADALAAVAVQLVTRTVSVLPLDTAGPWLRALVRCRPDRSETRLLAAAVRQAVDFADPGVDADIDAAADQFRRDGDTAGEIAALAVGTVAAHSRHDVARIVVLAARADSIPGSYEHPVVNLAVRSTAAVVAEMTGKPERALTELRRAEPEAVPTAVATPTYRFLFHCLLVTGRADEAIAVAARLQQLGHDQATYMLGLARWLAGDPRALLGHGELAERRGSLTSRDEFVRRAMSALVLASSGRCVALGREASRLPDAGAPGPGDNARDAVLSAVATAFSCVVAHDDERAAQMLAVAADPADSPVVEQHLRRFLPLVYVLHPGLRARWDQAPLGPSHQRWRSVSRLLLELRAGRRTAAESLDPAQAFTALPLPWSVELACRLHAQGSRCGQSLASWLVDAVPDRFHLELRRLAEGMGTGAPASSGCGSGAAVARAASELLKTLPPVPSRRLTISVLGPLQVRFDDVPTTSTALRRARVRTLLALLVVHRTLNRERAMDLLWPDLDPSDASRNLRVTLTYLRQLLEPERIRGEASFHLRADGTSISLHPSAHLSVDLWELQQTCREATDHREQARADRAVELLERATVLWRGDPLGDLGLVLDHEPEIERARMMQLGALLDLGELRLSRGETGEALLAAERALDLDPYLERAHRLALAAALHGRDRRRSEVVADRLRVALDELGVQPGPATLILLRQQQSAQGQRLVAAGSRS